MGDQRTFASVAWNQKGKVTRRERFLAEMDAVIPWGRLIPLIEPHYPKAGNGTQPLGLEKHRSDRFATAVRGRTSCSTSSHAARAVPSSNSPRIPTAAQAVHGVPSIHRPSLESGNGGTTALYSGLVQ